MTNFVVFGRIQLTHNSSVRVNEYGVYKTLNEAVERATEVDKQLEHVEVYIRTYQTLDGKLIRTLTYKPNGEEEI